MIGWESKMKSLSHQPLSSILMATQSPRQSLVDSFLFLSLFTCSTWFIPREGIWSERATIVSFHFQREWITKMLERFTCGTKLPNHSLKFCKMEITPLTLKKTRLKNIFIKGSSRSSIHSMKKVRSVLRWFITLLQGALRVISKGVSSRKTTGNTPKTPEHSTALILKKKYFCRELGTLSFSSRTMPLLSSKFGSALTNPSSLIWTLTQNVTLTRKCNWFQTLQLRKTLKTWHQMS